MAGHCVDEAHVLLFVHQFDIAGGSVALLADDHLDLALVLAGLVGVGTMQEDDRVGVLLQGAGFAEVAEAWPVIPISAISKIFRSAASSSSEAGND